MTIVGAADGGVVNIEPCFLNSSLDIACQLVMSRLKSFQDLEDLSLYDNKASTAEYTVSNLAASEITKAKNTTVECDMLARFLSLHL
jgi:hypothetical protein